MAAPLIRGDDIAIAEKICNVGIIVFSPIFANAVPRSYQKSKSVSLKTELGIHPVPTSRQRVSSAVGLMNQSQIDESARQAKQSVIRMDADMSSGS